MKEKRHIGKFSDLGEPKYRSSDKERYHCPYCVPMFHKSETNEATVSYNCHTKIGICFRCGTLIVNEGLTSLDYISENLNPKKSENNLVKIASQRVKINWTHSVLENKKAWKYLHDRNITNESMKRFNVRACNDPFLGIVYVNKIIDNEYTDFMQVRVINASQKGNRHLFLKGQGKVCNWLCHATTSDLVLVEGYTSGLSAYQHNRNSDIELNPIVLGGKTITDYQLSELQEFCSMHDSPTLWVCLDGGCVEEALKLSKKIYNKCYNLKIFIMNLPYKQDPNEVTRKVFLKTFDESLEYSPNSVNYIRDRIYKNVIR